MVTGWPSTRISPEVGVSVPDKILTSVLLPAPLSPMSAVTSPALTSKSAPASALTWPYTFVMSRASSTTVIAPLLVHVDMQSLPEGPASCHRCQYLESKRYMLPVAPVHNRL